MGTDMVVAAVVVVAAAAAAAPWVETWPELRIAGTAEGRARLAWSDRMSLVVTLIPAVRVLMRNRMLMRTPTGVITRIITGTATIAGS
jgi:hypothetical protein